MRNGTGHFKLGLFVIGALVLIVATVLLLGLGTLFGESFEMETYLDESVQGLSVGSPVKHRGVQIGVVEQITFVQNEYDLSPAHPLHDLFSRYVMIKMDIPGLLKGKSEEERRREIRLLIEKGLRIRFASQGLTGTAYLELDYLPPEKNPVPPVAWEPRSVYVPSAPSTITRISSALDQFFDKLEKTEVTKIARDLDGLIIALTREVEGARVGELRREASLLVSELRTTNKHLQSVIAKPGFQNSPERIERSLSHLDSTMRRLNRLVGDNRGEINETVQNLKTASENLKQMSDNAKRYPSVFFFGTPPAKSRTVKQ